MRRPPSPAHPVRPALAAAFAALALSALLAPAPVAASAVLREATEAFVPANPPRVDDSLVVSTAWLAARLTDPKVVVLHVGHGDDYAAGHVPGARLFDYGSIVTRNGEVGSELPTAERLREVFEAAGVGDSTTVVVYGHEAPMATRVLFTLDWLGHRRFALLDGGLAKWRREQRPLSTAAPSVSRGTLTPRPRPELVVTADWLTARAGRPGVALIDTRTDVEYQGTGSRYNVRSHGHLAGARQLEWQQLFDADGATLRPRDELRRLYADRVAAPSDTVVTYCLVGYRASATWFVARLLGYRAAMYDGSYQDWSARRLPLTAGP